MNMLASTARRLGIEDERSIIETLTNYATALDTRDWSLLRACFSEDCEADYGEFGKFRGPCEVAEYMRDAHAAVGPSLHRLSNFSVSDIGGQVHARTYVDAVLMSAHPGGPDRRGIGYYDDVMLRTSGGWKIARRKFTALKLL
jgi:SnoaL-like domain